MISNHVWKIPLERKSVNTVLQPEEEIIGAYTKEECSIPSGIGKYTPVQLDKPRHHREGTD